MSTALLGFVDDLLAHCSLSNIYIFYTVFEGEVRMIKRCPWF
jgi:hypothetical protein